jgi:hypothetical protein
MQSGKYRQLYKGQPIFEVGCPCTTFYVVLSGLVGCHTSDNLPQVKDGHKGRRYAHLGNFESPGSPISTPHSPGSTLMLQDSASTVGSTCGETCASGVRVFSSL